MFLKDIVYWYILYVFNKFYKRFEFKWVVLKFVFGN